MTRNELINKINEMLKNKKEIKNEGKGVFADITKKLDESRKLEEELRKDNFESLIYIKQIKDFTDSKSLNDLIDIVDDNNRLSDEIRSLESNEPLVHSDIILELKKKLNVNSIDQIIEKLTILVKIKDQISKLRREISSSNDIVPPHLLKDKSEIELYIQNLMDEIKRIHSLNGDSNQDLAHLCASLFNTFHRLIDDPKENYFMTHVRTLVHMTQKSYSNISIIHPEIPKQKLTDTRTED